MLRTLLRPRRSVPVDTGLDDVLRRYVNVSQSIFAVFSFSAIFVYKFELFDVFGIDSRFEIPKDALVTLWERLPELAGDLTARLSASWDAVLLFLVTVLWFRSYRHAVLNELDLLKYLYARSDVPDANQARFLVGYRYVPLLAFGLTFAFLAMAWFSDRPRDFLFIVLLMLLQDLNGNRLTRKNLRKAVIKAPISLSETDPEYARIQARRRIASVYWIERPQLERVVLMIIAVTAMLLATSADGLFGVALPLWTIAPFFTVLHFANFFVLENWRDHRDRAVRKLEDTPARMAV